MGSLSLLQVCNYTELLGPQVTLQREPWERVLLQPDALEVEACTVTDYGTTSSRGDDSFTSTGQRIEARASSL